MNIKTVYNSLKDYRQKGVRIYFPWNIFTLKHKEQIEVYIYATKYCIIKEDKWWCIYYNERGSDILLKQIEDESEASLYFYNLIIPKMPRS